MEINGSINEIGPHNMSFFDKAKISANSVAMGLINQNTQRSTVKES
jgi:hypothetical protein